MNAKEAKEIFIKGNGFKLEKDSTVTIHRMVELSMDTAINFGMAKGYIAALEGPEVKALVEAFKNLMANENYGCWKGEDDPVSETYMPCGKCVFCGAEDALSKFREAIKQEKI